METNEKIYNKTWKIYTHIYGNVELGNKHLYAL